MTPTYLKHTVCVSPDGLGYIAGVDNALCLDFTQLMSMAPNKTYIIEYSKQRIPGFKRFTIHQSGTSFSFVALSSPVSSFIWTAWKAMLNFPTEHTDATKPPKKFYIYLRVTPI